MGPPHRRCPGGYLGRIDHLGHAAGGCAAPDLARISEGEELSEEGLTLAAVGRPHRPRPSPAHALAFRPVADPVALLRGLSRPWSASPRALALAALPSGGIPTEAISAGIDTVYAGRWPDRPLWLCSYDLRAGRRVVFGRAGSPSATVGQAVSASCAIPMYFRPVAIQGRRYVDGGVHSMVNLDLLAGQELDLVLAISPMSQAAAFGVISPAMVMRQPLRSRLRAEVEALKRTGVPVVAVQPGRTVTSAMGLNPMDAAKRRAVSRATRDAVGRWLRDGIEGRHLARILRSASSHETPLAPVDAPVEESLA